MFINHETLHRLLDDAFDEYAYLRSLGNPDVVARERAINAVMPMGGFVPHTASGTQDRQLELPLEAEGQCTYPISQPSR